MPTKGKPPIGLTDVPAGSVFIRGTGTTIYGTNKQCRQHPLATVVAVCKAYMREQEHKEVHYPAEAGYVPPTEHIGYPTAPAAAALSAC